MNKYPAMPELERTTVIDLAVLDRGRYVSRFQREQGNQADIKKLEERWRKKFLSFGDIWDNNRQNYRFFNDTFRLFYYSFDQLRRNKISSIESIGTQETSRYAEWAGPNLAGVYLHGKKCISIIKELDLFNSLPKTDQDFMEKFSGTRNLVFEHNFNSDQVAFQIEPVLWTLVSTHSRLQINIHTATEAAHKCSVDYYEDYYTLEKILVDIIGQF